MIEIRCTIRSYVNYETVATLRLESSTSLKTSTLNIAKFTAVEFIEREKNIEKQTRGSVADVLAIFIHSIYQIVACCGDVPIW